MQEKLKATLFLYSPNLSKLYYTTCTPFCKKRKKEMIIEWVNIA